MNEKKPNLGYLVDGEGNVWIGSQRDFRNALGSEEYNRIATQLTWDGSRQNLPPHVSERMPDQNASLEKKKISRRPIIPQGSYPDQFVQIIDGVPVWVGPKPEPSIVQAKEQSTQSAQLSGVSRKLEIPETFPITEEEEHAHHFIYEEPNGEMSHGYCKKCGKKVSHKNWTDASDFVTSGEQRFAGLLTYNSGL